MAMYICPICGEGASSGEEHKCPPEPFNVLANRLKATDESPPPPKPYRKGKKKT